MTAETAAPDPTRSILAFFGSEVLRVRLKLGWSQAEMASKAHSTQAMISYIENAKRVPTETLANDLDTACDADGHFTRLHPLVLSYAYPSWFLPYIECERDAITIRSFDGPVVPGLLQTEEYARAMLDAVRPDNLDDLVAARMTRQGLFERETPPRVWFVVDEYALMRHIGGPAVMRGQFERLLTAGAAPRTVIQVIPRTVAAHPGLAGVFSLFTFEEGADVLHVDGFSKGRMEADPSEVRGAAHAYDLMRASALSPEASADLIGAHLKELDR